MHVLLVNLVRLFINKSAIYYDNYTIVCGSSLYIIYCYSRTKGALVVLESVYYLSYMV